MAIHGYRGRRKRKAKRLVRGRRVQLRHIEIWFFSSGFLSFSRPSGSSSRLSHVRVPPLYMNLVLAKTDESLEQGVYKITSRSPIFFPRGGRRKTRKRTRVLIVLFGVARAGAKSEAEGVIGDWSAAKGEYQINGFVLA